MSAVCCQKWCSDAKYHGVGENKHEQSFSCFSLRLLGLLDVSSRFFAFSHVSMLCLTFLRVLAVLGFHTWSEVVCFCFAPFCVSTLKMAQIWFPYVSCVSMRCLTFVCVVAVLDVSSCGKGTFEEWRRGGTQGTHTGQRACEDRRFRVMGDVDTGTPGHQGARATGHGAHGIRHQHFARKK